MHEKIEIHIQIVTAKDYYYYYQFTDIATYDSYPVSFSGLPTWNEFQEWHQFGAMCHETRRKDALLVHSLFYTETLFYDIEAQK